MSKQNVVLKSSELKPKPKLFLERTQVLQEISKKLDQKNTLIIYGKPGSGKTTLARWYASSKDNVIVREIKSEFGIKIFECYVEILKQVNPFNRRLMSIDKKMAISEMKMVLESITNKQVLFIFDHVSSYEVISEYLVGLSASAKLIITTRNREIFDNFEENVASLFQVNNLSRDEFSSYVKSTFKLQNLKLSNVQIEQLFSIVSTDSSDKVSPVNANKMALLISNNKETHIEDFIKLIKQNAANLFIKVK